MTKIIFIQPNGVEVVAEAVSGGSLMQLAMESKVSGILGECGGSLACGTCHVYVSEERFEDLPEMADGEREMLDFTSCERKANSRLCCQIDVTDALDGLRVLIPETQI